MVITSSSLKFEFDVLIEFDEFRPEYGIYYGSRIKMSKVILHFRRYGT